MLIQVTDWHGLKMQTEKSPKYSVIFRSFNYSGTIFLSLSNSLLFIFLSELDITDKRCYNAVVCRKDFVAKTAHCVYKGGSL